MACCHWGIWEATLKLKGPEASIISATKVNPLEKWVQSCNSKVWTWGKTDASAMSSFLMMVPILSLVWIP